MSNTNDFYVTGGSLRPDTPSYVRRRADDELYEGLRAGEFCYVLTSRQMGKSSLMVRTALRLRADGDRAAVIAFTSVGQNLAAEQWYYGLLDLLGEQLGLEEALDRFWEEHHRIGPLQRFMAALREVALAEETTEDGRRRTAQGRIPDSSVLRPPSSVHRLVIFMDEIDVVRGLPFATDELFAAIRECYNRRAEDPAFERLTFCLMGVAAPTDLIRDTRLTPFNIGRRIELDDFTEEEAAPLARGLEGSERHGCASRLLARVLYWTGGHPYLTQRLCLAVSEDSGVNTKQGVDRLVQGLFLSHRASERDDNLLFIRERILHSEVDLASLLDVYLRVRTGKRVRDDDTNALVGVLRLSGIVRVRHGVLRVRNRIYERVFSPQWVQTHMPDAETRRQRTAYRRGIARASGVYGALLAVMLGLTWYALLQKRASDSNATLANRAEQSARAQAAALRRQSYVADMSLIQRDWDDGRYVDVQNLLKETESYEGCGFEWGYWNHVMPRERVSLHPAGVPSATISSDGRFTVTSEGAGAVKLWDLKTGREVLSVKLPGASLDAVALSADGRRILAGDRRNVNLWDARDGRLLRILKPSDGSARHVNALAISADHRRVAALYGDKRASIWDTRSGKELLHFPITGDVREGGLWSVALSADGRRLVTPGMEARVWDAATGRLIQRFRGHTPATGAAYTIWAVACSGDGSRVLTAGSDGKAKAWDARTGRELRTLSDPDAGSCMSVALSADGRRIVTGYSNGIARVWDAQTGRELQKLVGPPVSVIFASVSADGKRIVTGSFGDNANRGSVNVWDAEEDRHFTLLHANAGKVAAIAYSPTPGRLVATAHYDHTARIWDSRTGRQLRVLRGHTSQIHFVAFSPDGARLVTAGEDGTARVWEVQTGREILRLLGHAGPVYCAAYSPDGNSIATSSLDHTARIWDARTGRERLRLQGEANAEIYWLAWSPDGVHIATSGVHHGVRLWDARTGREALRVRPREPSLGMPDNASQGMPAFSPDGSRLITGYYYPHSGTAGDVAVWDARTGRRILVLHGHANNPIYFAFSPDQRRIATGGNDNAVKIWDADTGVELLTLRGHTGVVQGLAFSPDGLTLATCSWDGTARLWRADSLAGKSL